MYVKGVALLLRIYIFSLNDNMNIAKEKLL